MIASIVASIPLNPPEFDEEDSNDQDSVKIQRNEQYEQVAEDSVCPDHRMEEASLAATYDVPTRAPGNFKFKEAEINEPKSSTLEGDESQTSLVESRKMISKTKEHGDGGGLLDDKRDDITISLSLEPVIISEIDTQLEISISTGNSKSGNPLNESTDHELICRVQEMLRENEILTLENHLFMSFLEKNDPALVEGLNDLIELAKKSFYESTTSIRMDTSSTISRTSRSRSDYYACLSSIADGKGPKINLPQKTEMVSRAIEEMYASLLKHMERSRLIKRNLEAESEEFSIREGEINEACVTFESNVVSQGVDKLFTRKTPAEKFLKYMDDWLKTASLHIDKLRLRIGAYKLQYDKISAFLLQKKELRDNVHAVDFDQLKIEKKQFRHDIEENNLLLRRLKIMNRHANVLLSDNKNFVQKQQEDFKTFTEQLCSKYKETEEIALKTTKAMNEITTQKHINNNCTLLKEVFSVPDIMEYVENKKQLDELKKQIKLWTGRRKIQDIALNTCIGQMKQLTGAETIEMEYESGHSF